MYTIREESDLQFNPLTTAEQDQHREDEITDFVPKPLYTKRQLHAFRDRNMKDGAFVTTKETVSSIEDLEKMMFLWQEITENQSDEDVVNLGGEFTSPDGYTFSELTIRNMHPETEA